MSEEVVCALTDETRMAREWEWVAVAGVAGTKTRLWFVYDSARPVNYDMIAFDRKTQICCIYNCIIYTNSKSLIFLLRRALL